jgi:hypothetical protein
MRHTISFPGGRQIGQQGAFTFPSGYATDRLGAAFLAGNDWRTKPALSFAKDTASGACSDPPRTDDLFATPPGTASYPSGFKHTDAHLQYVNDPIFGTVVRGRYPYCTTNHFYHNKTYAYTASDKVWIRQVVKFEANNYTTLGSDPVAANSHKVMFLTWAGGVGARLELEIVGTSWVVGGSQTGRTFTEQDELGNPGKLTASTFQQNDTVQPMLTDAEWYEMVLNYEIRTGGANGKAIAREFYRPISTGDATVLDTTQVWERLGWFWQFTGGSVPAQAGGYQFFGNRNRSTDLYPSGAARPEVVGGHDPFYVWYGPHEVVDGSLNNDPYGLQGWGE